MTIIKSIIDKVRQAWPVNRVVTVLTPIVFVPVAGYIATWVAQHFPGIPPIDPGWLAGIFILGATAALTTAYKWLDGWQAYEKQIASPTEKPVLAPEHRKRPPEVKEGGTLLPPGGDARGDSVTDDDSGLDDDALLSQPDDIAESDADDPDLDERVEREELERPQ